MALRLWPEKFAGKDHITREEKFLLRKASQNLHDGHFAVGIDPAGMSTEKVHMGFYIAPDKGLITFSIYTDSIDQTLLQAYKIHVEMVERRICERLLDSKMLIVREGEKKCLGFPYRHMIIFANEKPVAISPKDSIASELENYAYIQFLKPVSPQKAAGKEKAADIDIAAGCRVAYDHGFSKLSDRQCRAIFERIAPEYMVIMNEQDHVDVKEVQDVPVELDFKITGREQEYKTFFLDEYQVAQVNDMGKGHRVLLANPGAGKSVLLLSKAYKYASLYKDSKVLLTCFNSNLADAYIFKRDQADFGDNRNLYIMTFHKLVKRLFEDCLHRRCRSNIAAPEEIQECIDKVRAGEIRIRFKAIFIDEVQIFEPMYLELCYALLEKTEDAAFLMAGDLNQTVRSQSRRGDAPWKKINGVNLNFTGRVKYIERNYRNSRQIGVFLNRMLCYMNHYMEELNMISLKEFEYDSFEPGDHDGIALKIRTGIDRMQIQAFVLDAVKEIVQKYQTAYSDIAVLFPVKQHRALNYYFLHGLTDALDHEGIPYSLIISSGGDVHKKVRYSKTAGIVLSTIDSSLGLDFKAVIVAGLFPYNYFFTDNGSKVPIVSWAKIGQLGKHEQEKVQIQMRKLYTACSRARDILYVLSDMQLDTPMEQLLTEAQEKK